MILKQALNYSGALSFRIILSLPAMASALTRIKNGLSNLEGKSIGMFNPVFRNNSLKSKIKQAAS
jgi:hypothetical protein